MSGIHAKILRPDKSLVIKVRLGSGRSLTAKGKFVLLMVLCWCALSLPIVSAQMIGVGTPMNGFGNSWYERQGVGFGFSLPGGQWGGSRVVGLLPNGQFNPTGHLQFTQGSFGSAIPTFGGYDPNAAGRFGFGVGGQGGGFRLGLEFGKGSTRTITSTAPSLMVQNGAGGFISSGQWTPFVTGWIPVVGNYSGPQPIDNAVTRAVQSGQLRLDNLGSRSYENSALPTESSSRSDESLTRSTAETASESVAAIRATKAAEKEAVKQQLAELMAEYERHLAAGDRDLARLAIVRAIPLEKDATKKQKLRDLLKSTK
jgi:hypothetical protein